MVFKKLKYFYPLAALLTLHCFTSDKSLPGISGTGQITGQVVDFGAQAIENVEVRVYYQDKLYRDFSKKNGNFTISIPNIERGSSLNVQFVKDKYASRNYSAQFKLPNLVAQFVLPNPEEEAVIKSILTEIFPNGNYTLPNINANIPQIGLWLTDTEGAPMLWTRKVTGQIYDNFSYKPLANANVSVTDLAGHVVQAQTNASGKFTLESYHFSMGDFYTVTAFKSNYITRNDLIVQISAEESAIRNSPIRLYNKFGAIYGYLTEDNLGTALNGVSATLTNSNNQQITCNSGGPYNANGAAPYEPLADGQYCPDMDDDYNTAQSGANGGGFKIKDQFLHLGKRYTVTLSRTSANCTNRVNATSGCYRGKTTYADVLLTGNNAIPGGTVALLWDSWIHGTVSAGAGVTVKLYNSSNTYITEVTTNASGVFLLDHAQILRNQQYKLTFEKVGYYSKLIGLSAPNDPVLITITVAGANNAGAVTMTALPPPSNCVSGTVTDYWTSLPVADAAIAINDGGWRTTTTNALGQFRVDGNFTDTSKDAYLIEISKTGYTGSTLVSKQSFTFTHDGSSTCTMTPYGGTPYNLDTQLACDVASAPPMTGGTNCVSKLKLFPLGIYAVINGSTKYFNSQIKQTYEKFLTEKAGLTISGRTGNLILTSSMPQKTYDFDGIYLHFDDTPRILSNVREGRWSNHVPINPMSTKCSTTVTHPCSPVVNGALTEGIGGDDRTIPWELKSYIYYHFFAAAPGTYTIQTTGTTDTYMTLYSNAGADLGSNDDGGTGSNASISITLLRGWYYVKIRGKNDNVFGFFDVNVTGPAQAESNYSSMLSPAVEPYQTVNGSATYQTNCAPNNGNMVLSWYDSSGHLLYVAAPGELTSPDPARCTAAATIEKHGAIGEIIRGRFDGLMRPIAAVGASATVTNTLPFRGFYNIIRME